MSQDHEREGLFADWDREFRGIVAKFARSYSRGPKEADELTQEMRLQLWHSTRLFKGTAQASTWVYRVCLNTAMAWRLRTRANETGHADDFESIPSGERSPAQQSVRNELLERLYAAIRKLPDVDRGLVLMSLDGLSYREISEVMGLTENHVGVALTRARKKLAETMKGGEA